jgi:hypothetical protein
VQHHEVLHLGRLLFTILKLGLKSVKDTLAYLSRELTMRENKLERLTLTLFSGLSNI